MHANLPARFTVELLDWSRAFPLAAQVRRRVFIEEQGVPEILEWDEQDASAFHALALDQTGSCLGTGRVILDEHPGTARIGRMAVLAGFRHMGIGSAILDACLAKIRDSGATAIHLHAQLAVTRFYARRGFREVGTVFEEAGIAHIRMHMPAQAIRKR